MHRFITRLLFICILLFATSITQAQQGRVDGSKRKAKQYEKAINAIREQTQTIVKGATTDEDKVLSIYKWLRDNVKFDNNLWVHIENLRYKGIPGKKGLKTYWQYAKFTLPLKLGLYKLADLETAEKTFKRKKGVSMGIAGLFEIMCVLADVNAVSVNGYAKGYKYEVGDQFHYGNHTWNAVKTGSNWRLLDVTWGYTITEPELFIRKHAPLDPVWQLLDKPVSIGLFEKDTLVLDKYIG